MIRFLVRRLSLALLSVILVSSLIMAIIYYSPVDPSRLSFGQRSDEETISLYKKKYYLDKPLSVQILRVFEDLSPLQWIPNSDPRLADYSYSTLYKGELSKCIFKKPYFRKSYVTGQNVWDLIKEAIPGTFVLALTSVLVAIILGIVLGLMASLKFESWIDRTIMLFCSIAYAVPSYVSALFFGIVFAYSLGEYTGLPIQGSLWDFDDMGNQSLMLSHLILPVLALGIRPVSMIAQMTRASALDVLGADYIRTARSKGIGNILLLSKHVLPNCLNAIITTISSWFAALLTGSYFVEYIFNYKGLGLLTISAVNSFDIPLISGTCIITVIIFAVINVLTDIGYVYLDPRIKLN